MTVAELIAKLAEYPPDAVVVYRAYSDWNGLEADDITLYRAEDKEVTRYQGRTIHAKESWYAQGQRAEWLTVVAFPGN